MLDFKEQVESQRDTFMTYGSIETSFKKLAMPPLAAGDKKLDDDQLEQKIRILFEWAKRKGAQYYALLTYPKTERISQKQQNFVEMDYTYQNFSLNANLKWKLSSQFFKLGEADGSSFPSGGLRCTERARTYTIWDNKSEIYIRQKNKVMYIPSLLISHDGFALDDKTLFRNSEKILNQKSKHLLNLMGISTNKVVMALGLEQQFFVIPKSAYDKRSDIKNTGRALYGAVPVKNQQFSDHYYGKIAPKMEQIFKEIEQQLLEIGVPVKTRHKQVALNQYQFCPLYEEAGKCIDHNMLLMEILRESFERHGYAVLLHEKPFNQLNGSGKHCNWSLNYINGQNKLKNLFQTPKSQEEKKIFKMFILINLMAIMNNSKLYLSSIASTGNQLRLGGHQAPPRVISVFLGSTISALLDNKEPPIRQNLKDLIQTINYNVYQEDTDRNRTSPYAYTGNKFQFRAVGSSQNVSYPMAVIAATIADEVTKVVTRIQKGQSIDSIIQDLTQKTQAIRFSGNGYSPDWKIQAKKKGLFVNQNFEQNYENIKQNSKVFERIGVCKQKQNQSKQQSMIQIYNQTVKLEAQILLRIIDKQVINRCYNLMKTIAKIQKIQTSVIKNHSDTFRNAFQELLISKSQLNQNLNKVKTLKQMNQLRKMIGKVGKKIEEVMNFLPRDPKYPDLDEILGYIDQ